MKTGPNSSFANAASRSVRISERPAWLARLADYIELTRPRIALMAMLTVTVGYVLAAEGAMQAAPLMHALFGIGLVAVSSSALNQFLERHTDARMARTNGRPLPAGRLLPWEVLSFGLFTGLGGCVYLLITVNPLTALLAFATLVIYVGAYTPLKSRSRWCTTVGAVAGALPPVLGWTAACGELTFGALALFSVLFFWQFPHFLAIAWLHKEDYDEAGLKMLPRRTGRIALVCAILLIPASLMPGGLSIVEPIAGGRYVAAAVVLSLVYLIYTIRFARRATFSSARELLIVSLIYLPLLLTILTWDHFSMMH